MPLRFRSYEMFAKRPFWRSYLTAFVLLGLGMELIDIGASPPRSFPLEVIAAVFGSFGLVVFFLALGSSLWCAVRSKRCRKGAA